MKTLLYGLIPLMLVKGANALDKADLAKLETLVKNDPKVIKGSVTLNNIRSDAYKIMYGNIEFEFSKFGIRILRKLEKGIEEAIYDINKDGKFDGASWSDKPRYSEAIEISVGNLKNIDFIFKNFIKDILQAKKRLNINEISDVIYGVHPDGSIVKADFLTGKLKKEKDDNLKKDLQGSYNTFIEGLRNHYKLNKLKKDALYKRK